MMGHRNLWEEGCECDGSTVHKGTRILVQRFPAVKRCLLELYQRIISILWTEKFFWSFPDTFRLCEVMRDIPGISPRTLC